MIALIISSAFPVDTCQNFSHEPHVSHSNTSGPAQPPFMCLTVRTFLLKRLSMRKLRNSWTIWIKIFTKFDWEDTWNSRTSREL